MRYGPALRPRGAFRGREVNGLPDRMPSPLRDGGNYRPDPSRIGVTSASTSVGGWRNINRLSIGYALGPRLRTRLTLGGLTFPRKPCAFGGRASHPSCRYSFRHTHSSPLHRSFRSGFAAGDDALLPFLRIRDCGSTLSPRHFRRGMARPVSCYALLKWWLLLSQHPGCHGDPTSFATERRFGGLGRRSGLFPSRA